MRKWNTILSVLMLLIFMIHGIMGSFMLNGVGSSAGKLLAWIGVGILVVHTVIGVILTVQSLQTAKQSGKMYLKQNAIFWARRASGLAILILLFFHIGLFGKVQNGTYILFPFTTVKMVTQLLFVAAIIVYVQYNIYIDICQCMYFKKENQVFDSLHTFIIAFIIHFICPKQPLHSTLQAVLPQADQSDKYHDKITTSRIPQNISSYIQQKSHSNECFPVLHSESEMR